MDEEIKKGFAAALAKVMAEVLGSPDKPTPEVEIVYRALELAEMELVRVAKD